MHIYVSITKNTKTKPERSDINVNWTRSLYFNSPFRYFGFVSVFRFRFGKSRYPATSGVEYV